MNVIVYTARPHPFGVFHCRCYFQVLSPVISCTAKPAGTPATRAIFIQTLYPKCLEKFVHRNWQCWLEKKSTKLCYMQSVIFINHCLLLKAMLNSWLMSFLLLVLTLNLYSIFTKALKWTYCVYPDWMLMWTKRQ